MNDQDLIELTNQLKRHEGFRSKPYRDSVGVLTVGYGRNLDHVGLSESESSYLLQGDIDRARSACDKAFPWFANITPKRKAVVINMVFNLGLDGFKEFKNTIEAMSRSNAELASQQMLKSKWADQVGSRARELAEQYRKG